jgi:hypothetical protein
MVDVYTQPHALIMWMMQRTSDNVDKRLDGHDTYYNEEQLGEHINPTTTY